jgi:hypothetical protein
MASNPGMVLAMLDVANANRSKLVISLMMNFIG